jgi:wobble nucleotide-excising tRNase
MINRIRLLRNVGKFDSVDTAANFHLARVTVIYAENGRGKTTFVAILRSLATGDPIPIAERHRLAAPHPPHVVLDCIGGPPDAVFQNGSWNRTIPEMVVFDDVFVDTNVYSGLAIGPDHRQNLHELILGAHGVALNQQLHQFVTQIETHNAALRAKAALILGAERGIFSVDEFCALPARTDIDDAIQAGERALAAAQEQETVRTTSPFGVLSLPSFDVTAIEQVLQQNLPQLDDAAAARVQIHLAGIGRDAEAWVADGMMRVLPIEADGSAGPCPFCAQNLKASPVINYYRAYFSEGYAVLKRTVSQTIATINRTLGDEVPASFERGVRVAGERRQFWARFSSISTLVY